MCLSLTKLPRKFQDSQNRLEVLEIFVLPMNPTGFLSCSIVSISKRVIGRNSHVSECWILPMCRASYSNGFLGFRVYRIRA